MKASDAIDTLSVFSWGGGGKYVVCARHYVYTERARALNAPFFELVSGPRTRHELEVMGFGVLREGDWP